MMRRISGIFLCLICISLPSFVAADILDDFDSYTEGVIWEAVFHGAPQTMAPDTIDGRSVVRMESTGANYIRGIRSIQSWQDAVNQIELDFRTDWQGSNYDAILGMGIRSLTNGHWLQIELFGGNFGGDRTIEAKTSLGNLSERSPSGLWDYNQWYQMSIDGDQTTSTLSLRTDNESVIWSHDFGFGLDSFGEYEIELFQRGSGFGPNTRVALDQIRTSSVPEPAHGCGIICLFSLVAAGFRRRRQKNDLIS